MSQKKISSFFKTSAPASSNSKTEKEPPAAEKEPPAAASPSPEKDVNGHTSPVKAPARRRIRMISDSDEEIDQKKAAPDKVEELAVPSTSKTPSPPPAVEEPTLAKRRTARKTAKRSPDTNLQVGRVGRQATEDRGTFGGRVITCKGFFSTG
ncbi:DNA ligase 1-like [Dermacentor silvarum]|uniref:DNA ligase 1-like n=1 Tax=Dermacentor silvarum TaxID=543639 RepID=UPI002100D6CC|nr:DNA ligase 1-like [Dermacentor silvarum]